MPGARSATGTARVPRQASPASGAGDRLRFRPHGAAEAIDREHLLDRLQYLRGVVPHFAQGLASARTRPAAPRVENRGLLEEVRRLRKERESSSRSR